MDKFIDDTGVIRVGNGLVRVQTIRRMTTKDDEQRIQERGDLIMPITSFLNLHAGLNRAVEEMLEKGLLRRREDDAIEKTDEADNSEDSEVVDTQDN
jgi:hypothetical protein